MSKANTSEKYNFVSVFCLLFDEEDLDLFALVPFIFTFEVKISWIYSDI